MLEFAKKLSKRAGKLALGYYKKGVKAETKSTPDNLVTIADRAVSDFIIQEIKKKFSNHGIISEEEDEPYNPGAEYVWVVDPIDGTRNFANHVPFWCVMIGIERNGQPYIGVVYDALHDEIFVAEKGKGAFCSNKKIQVRSLDDLDSCFISFCAGVMDPASPYLSGKLPKFRNFFNNITSGRGHWLHHYGCMLEVCYVAAGRLDALLKDGILYHDCLAPYVIAIEAGALVTDIDGNNWKKGEKHMVVANPKLHKKLLKLFYAK